MSSRAQSQVHRFNAGTLYFFISPKTSLFFFVLWRLLEFYLIIIHYFFFLDACFYACSLEFFVLPITVSLFHPKSTLALALRGARRHITLTLTLTLTLTGLFRPNCILLSIV